MISQEDERRIQEMKAKAWDSISTYHSVADMSRKKESFTMTCEALLDQIARQKRAINKLIDSIPD